MKTPREYAECYNTPEHWCVTRVNAQAQGSDGCTGIFDICPDACYEHDLLYCDHVNRDGDPVSRDWADALFKIRHEQVGRPIIGLIFWKAVRIHGRPYWEGHLMFDFYEHQPTEAP